MENFEALSSVVLSIALGIAWYKVVKARNELGKAQTALNTPVKIWCRLHRKNKDYRACVQVDRNGVITAPQDHTYRILREIDKGTMVPIMLGAPIWIEKEARSISGLDNRSVRFVEMLGSVYTFSPETTKQEQMLKWAIDAYDDNDL